MLEQDTELKNTPERAPRQVFYDLLNGVGNHEAKMLVTAIIASQPGRWFSTTVLKHELRSRQGTHPGWIQEPTTTFGYCSNSLEPIGAVVKGRIAGKYQEVDAYKASDIGQKHGLAFAGEILDWSLAYPNVSVQQILGSTSTSGSVRSPGTRFHAFEAILSHPTENPSQKEIIDSLSDMHSEKGVENCLDFMRQYGFIEITATPQEDFNPLVAINGPASNKEVFRIGNGARAVRSAIDELHKQGVTELQFSQILKNAISANPDVDPIAIRDSLVRGINSKSTVHPQLKAIDRKGIIRDKSVVRLAGETSEAIEDLINRLERLLDGNNLESSRQKALSIVNDPDKVSTLMEKARIFSPSYQGVMEGGTQDLHDRVLRIASTMGRLSSKEVRARLKEEDRPLSQGRTGQILRALVAEGRLKALDVEPDASRKRKIILYEAVALEDKK